MEMMVQASRWRAGCPFQSSISIPALTSSVSARIQVDSASSEVWERSRYVSQNPDRVRVVRPGSNVIQFLKFAEAVVVLADDFLDTPNQAVSAILAIPATSAISSRMVYCGKPSKGCASCRAKKTKVRRNVQLSFLGFRGHPGIRVNSI